MEVGGLLLVKSVCNTIEHPEMPEEACDVAYLVEHLPNMDKAWGPPPALYKQCDVYLQPQHRGGGGRRGSIRAILY